MTKLRAKKKAAFTLIEVIIVIGLLTMLISTFSFLGIDALKEFRRRNGTKAFKEYLTTLTHKNGLLENHTKLFITQEGNYILTKIEGNTKGLNITKRTRQFYVGIQLEKNIFYTIAITPQIIPDEKNLWNWIKKQNKLPD